jgi:acetate kinase
MRLLVVNAGSSSLKLSLLGPTDETLAATTVEDWSGPEDTVGLERFLEEAGDVDAVGHRVVHGGSRFTGPALLDEKTHAGIAELTDLAPLHQPRALAGIEAARRALPEVPAVACFDTAFHATLPAAAATYALPASWRRRWELRRYGFHGLSHAYAARRAAAVLDRPADELRLVTAHLGAGASLCAVEWGRSVDTTMGFTPAEGLVMATRPGNVDPGLLVWLLRHSGLSLDELDHGLEHSSGLAGLAPGTGGGGDLRAVSAAAARRDPEAVTALAVYVHRLRREIAAMTAAMDGLDALVFTGGVGEHSARVRAATAAGLGFLGIALHPELNGTARPDADIATAAAPVRTLVVAAREDLEIARQAREILRA